MQNEFYVTIEADDQSHRDEVQVAFSCAEWERLVQFHREAETLRSTRFVQEEMGGSISLSFSSKTGLVYRAKAIDTEAFWAMLLKLRPFVLEGEACNFNKVRGMLGKNLQHLAFKNHLKLIKEIHNLKHMNKIIRLEGNSRSLLSYGLLKDWLNGFEYHKEKEKRERVIAELGVFGQDQEGRPIVTFALVDVIQGILYLSDLIETLFISQENGSSIRCPAEFFVSPADAD